MKITALVFGLAFVIGCGSAPSEEIETREGASQVFNDLNPWPRAPDTINDMHMNGFHKLHSPLPFIGGLAVPFDKQAYYSLSTTPNGDPNTAGTTWTFIIKPEVANVNPWRTGDITTPGALNCPAFTVVQALYTDTVNFWDGDWMSFAGAQWYWYNTGTVSCTAYIYKTTPGHPIPAFFPVNISIPPGFLIFYTADEDSNAGWTGDCRDPGWQGLPAACNNAFLHLGTLFYQSSPGVPINVPVFQTSFAPVY